MVKLRKLEPTDLPYVYQWENDAESWPDGAIHNPISQQDLRAYIASTTGDLFRDGQLRLVVEAEDATVGCVDLFDLDIRNRKAAIGMYIAPAFRRKGYGREAIEQLVDMAFRQQGLRMVYAIISETNRACNALYEKLKFTNTARLQAWTLEGDAQMWQKVIDD